VYCPVHRGADMWSPGSAGAAGAKSAKGVWARTSPMVRDIHTKSQPTGRSDDTPPMPADCGFARLARIALWYPVAGWSPHGTRALRAGHSPRSPTRRFRRLFPRKNSLLHVALRSGGLRGRRARRQVHPRRSYLPRQRRPLGRSGQGGTLHSSVFCRFASGQKSHPTPPQQAEAPLART
jgi:hypothetical protein